MPHRPRIALVGPWGGTVGGVTTFMKNVVRSTLGDAHEFLRFNTARPPKQNVIENYGYGAIWKGGIRRLIIGGAVTVAHMIAFPFWILLRRPDVVQVQSSDFQTFWESGFYVGMCRLMHVPVVERLGGSFDYFYSASSPRARGVIRRLLQWPDALIVQSDYWRGFVANLGRTHAVNILPNWVADDFVNASLARPAERVCTCLFSAGSEAVRKGIDDVVAAAVALKAAHVNVRFRIVAATGDLAERIAKAGISDIVELLGYVGREEMIELLRNTDVFLLPSRGEGFPNALVEAMATGLACVVTPVGSIPEITQGDAAILVPVKDPAALADAIARLATDSALRARIGAAALGAVRARYTEAAVLPRLERVWRAVLPAAHVPGQLRRLTLLGPVAEYGQPALGGFESGNLRLLNVLRDIVPNARSLSYPRAQGSQQRKTWQYFVGFFWLACRIGVRSGKESAIHFTPHCRHFIGAELFLAGVAKARGNRLTIDLRAGIHKDFYDEASALYRRAFRRLLSLAAAITYEGEAYAPWVQSLAPSTKRVCLPNFVPRSMLHGHADTALPSAPNLIYVGAVSREKGVDAALQVFRHLKQRLPQTKLTFVGRFEPQYWEELQHSGLLCEGVSFTGQLPLSMIEPRLDDSHFFIFLTQWFGEGHSNALTEAMARGCVPIASDHGFNRFVIANPDLLIADRNDPQGIARRIEDIWTAGQWRMLSDQMVARVSDYFTDRQARQVLAEIYGAANPVSPVALGQVRTPVENV